MNTTDPSTHCVEICNSLLRGELSAVETYTQTIDKFSGEPEAAALTRIRSEHEVSAQRLTDSILEMGGSPSDDSGAWGTFANTVEGAAKLFGDTSALQGLESGEEYGRGSYEAALGDDQVLPQCKQMIESELLPRQHEHIAALEAMKKAQ